MTECEIKDRRTIGRRKEDYEVREELLFHKKNDCVIIQMLEEIEDILEQL